MECVLCCLIPCECGQMITRRMVKRRHLLRDPEFLKARVGGELYREGYLAKNAIRPFSVQADYGREETRQAVERTAAGR